MSSLKHMQQLDGLRGIAIFCVFLAHFLEIKATSHFFLPYGSFGVRLFFVLSGFLITGILIKAKDRITAGDQSFGYTLRAFYIRRCLRLFIVYYAWLIANQIVFGGERFWWDFFYVSNFYDIIFRSGAGNQYWSLAVEEQFYLVWPAVILLLPRGIHKSVFLTCIIGSALLRVGMATAGYEYLIVKKFTLTCADALAGGALLAHFQYGDTPWKSTSRLTCSVAFFTSGAILFTCAIASMRLEGDKGAFYTATLHFGLALISIGMVIPAITGYNGLIGDILSSAWLCFLGRISYGCYIYHLIIREAVLEAAYIFGMEQNRMLLFVPMMLLTVLLSWISWAMLESPVNRLKTFFPMTRLKVKIS